MAQQLFGAAGQGVPRGLVPTDQDEQGLVDDLIVGELLAVDLGVDQDADEVVGGLAPARGDHLLHEGRVGAQRLHRRGPDLLGGRGRQRDHHVVAPRQQGLAVGRCHTEHVADHGHRQRGGKVTDEVTLSALTDRVDQRIAQRRNGFGPIAHALSSEARVDELAPQQVRRIVHVDHVRKDRAGGPDAARIGEQLGCPLGVDQRAMGGNGGQAVAVTEDRLVHPHPAVGRPGVRVGVEASVGQVDIGPRDPGIHHSCDSSNRNWVSL